MQRRWSMRERRRESRWAVFAISETNAEVWAIWREPLSRCRQMFRTHSWAFSFSFGSFQRYQASTQSSPAYQNQRPWTSPSSYLRLDSPRKVPAWTRLVSLSTAKFHPLWTRRVLVSQYSYCQRNADRLAIQSCSQPWQSQISGARLKLVLRARARIQDYWVHYATRESSRVVCAFWY